MPKPSTRCLAAEAGARTEGFIKRREIEGHTTSNLFYIQHMQTKFAALHLFFFFFRIGCLETSSAQLSLDFMIRRSKDVQVKLQHFNTLQDLLHAEINHHLIHIILPRSELLNAFEFSWNKSSTVPHWDLIVVQRFITEACRSRSTRQLTHELWWNYENYSYYQSYDSPEVLFFNSSVWLRKQTMSFYLMKQDEHTVEYTVVTSCTVWGIKCFDYK